jgi:hypothetical protein
MAYFGRTAPFEGAAAGSFETTSSVSFGVCLGVSKTTTLV